MPVQWWGNSKGSGNSAVYPAGADPHHWAGIPIKLKDRQVRIPDGLREQGEMSTQLRRLDDTTPAWKPPPWIAPALSLDTTTKTAREPDNRSEEYLAWLRRRRRNRLYQRAMSGMRVGGNLKFVTLTTSREAMKAGLDIRASWRTLLQRLRRRSLCSGYVKVMEYTKAGLPHMHLVMRGPWLSQSWLSEQWAQIHLSPIVDVRRVQRRDGAASYLAKYMGKSLDARYSWSWDWVWRGFVKDWRHLLADGFDAGADLFDIIAVWELILMRYGAGLRSKG